jgi:hypothetical protein
MLFMAERVAELAAISSRELPPLCAIAYVLDSAKTDASVMIATFMVILPVLHHSNPAERLRLRQNDPARYRLTIRFPGIAGNEGPSGIGAR